MPEFLDRLDDTVATVVEAGGGRTLPSMSHDSIRWSVFQDAADAVSAALRMHAEVEKDRWPDGIRITIGVAIDSGSAPLRNRGDYYGPTVARAWRTAPRVPPRATVLSRLRQILPEHECRPASCWSKYHHRAGEDGKLFALVADASQRFRMLDSPAAAPAPRSIGCCRASWIAPTP